MFAAIPSATVLGAEGQPVTVEVHVTQGLPAFTVVGLPDESCRESRDRVRAAFLSSSLPWPSKRVTVNLAPTTRRKGGAGLDVAIAIAVLVAMGELPHKAVADLGFIGELGLDGSIRAVPGMVPLVAALDAAVPVVPSGCEREAAVVSARARSVGDLADLVAALKGLKPWPEPDRLAPFVEPPLIGDLADVRGQAQARLAIEVAAAGNHHLLMVGPPGAGKTLIAERLQGLLPPLSAEEGLDVTKIHSAAGLPLGPGGVIRRAPFRAPHHTSSVVSIIGGGTASMRPGEVSLASGGVLFLDELSEFPGALLDSLRQPLEEGVVRIARARASVEMPARFLLVGAANPCACDFGANPMRCQCSNAVRERHMRRLSGPLLDRFDLRIPVDRVAADDLFSTRKAEDTATVAQRVVAARARAMARTGCPNGHLSGAVLEELVTFDKQAAALVRRRIESGQLSGRGLQRIRRVALTLADLGQVDGPLGVAEVATALALRCDPLSLRERAA